MKKLTFVVVALFFGGCLGACGSDPAGLFALGHVLQQQQLDDLQEQIDGIEVLPGPAGDDGITTIIIIDGAPRDDENNGDDGGCTRVAICHVDGNTRHTIEICENAVQAHLDHGDTMSCRPELQQLDPVLWPIESDD